MKIDFTAEEFGVLMMSLIRRRTDVQGLMKVVLTPNSIVSYTKELEVVEAMLEKVSPGSVEVIRQTEKVS